MSDTQAIIDEIEGRGNTLGTIDFLHEAGHGLLAAWVVAYRRPDPVFPDRPWVVHYAYVREDGSVALGQGSYDLTWAKADAEVLRRRSLHRRPNVIG